MSHPEKFNWSAFWRGFDIFGAMFPTPPDLPKTDEEALERDMQALADDFNTVINDQIKIARCVMKQDSEKLSK
jgi:hypothetical protein